MSGQLFCTSTPLSVSPGVGLTDFLYAPTSVSCWLHEGYGLVGLGRLLTLSAPPAEPVSTASAEPVSTPPTEPAAPTSFARPGPSPSADTPCHNPPRRIEQLRQAWRHEVGQASWVDQVRRPGSGPLALGAITFSATSQASSVLVVPQVLVGRDRQGWWLTRFELSPATTAPRSEVFRGQPYSPQLSFVRAVAENAAENAGLADILDFVCAQGQAASATKTSPAGAQGQASAATSASSPAGVGQTNAPVVGQTSPAAVESAKTSQSSTLSDSQWTGAVELATQALKQNRAIKVVLARDSYLSSSLTLGAALEHLATRFATTWTFSVDGMIGASPEMLLQLREREVFSRVLAGTARRRANMDQGELEQLANWLRGSPKNYREHQLAAASAVKALTPITEQLRVSEPFALTLPNVIHLATDIYGQVAGDTGALALVEALHPTAAVCGTPTAAAAQLIGELEGMDRERYAGPVGWVDWRGEGQWCIALRSGQVLSPTAQTAGTQGGPAGYPMGNQPVGSVRIFAGAGIMPDSVAADELAETNAKMAPMRAALGL
mgnify:FL=1